jgi:tRNA(adenine34) deaminase
VDAFNHRVDVVWGVLEQECSAILKDFFRELRKNGGRHDT